MQFIGAADWFLVGGTNCCGHSESAGWLADSPTVNKKNVVRVKRAVAWYQGAGKLQSSRHDLYTQKKSEGLN